MANELGGVLIVDSTGGTYTLPNECVFPTENGFSALDVSLNIESETTKIAPGLYLPGPSRWSPTTIQIPLFMHGDTDKDGDALDDPNEGIESNMAEINAELSVDGVIWRDATYVKRNGDEFTGRLHGTRVSSRGNRRPSGWPITFEFVLYEPFMAAP